MEPNQPTPPMPNSATPPDPNTSNHSLLADAATETSVNMSREYIPKAKTDKNNKTTLLLILIILVLAAAGAIAYFLLLN